MTEHYHPLKQAQDLIELEADILEKIDPVEEANRLVAILSNMIQSGREITNDSMSLLFTMSPYGRALYVDGEALGLRRGYNQARVMAAYDVRMGLDTPIANGGVHYDSDVESPPEWLMRMAERLARGDA